jgi:hypothetical protein
MKMIKIRVAARRKLEDAAKEPDGAFGWEPPPKDSEVLLSTFAARLDRRRKGRP